jgi:hypothetical protein
VNGLVDAVEADFLKRKIREGYPLQIDDVAVVVVTAFPPLLLALGCIC